MTSPDFVSAYHNFVADLGVGPRTQATFPSATIPTLRSMAGDLLGEMPVATYIVTLVDSVKVSLMVFNPAPPLPAVMRAARAFPKGGFPRTFKVPAIHNPIR